MTVLDDLDPAQRAAVVSEAAPLCILAGAGSGKTRVLTRRIAHRVRAGAAEADRTLAITFTRKAAGELRTRLGVLGVGTVTAGTFHSIALGGLRRWWDKHQVPTRTVLRDPARLVASLLTDDRSDATARAVAQEVAWAKARLVTPDRYEAAAGEAGRRVGMPPAAVAAVYQRYEEAKHTRRVLDFDDLLLDYAAALETDRAFADGERWWFRHLFVDEFQDVNPVQFRLLRAWLGDSTDLTVVGDPNQAVYGWNGADPDVLLRFVDHFPTAEVVRLDTNHRSTPEIVRVANSVLERNAGGESGGAGPSRPPRHPGRPAGGIPTVSAFHTEIEEARGIARGLRLAHRPGTPWSDLAVLARTNSRLRIVEEALRTAGIPHRSRASQFLGAPEVRAAVRRLAGFPSILPFASALADLDEAVVDAGDERERDNLVALLRLAREYDHLDRAPTGVGFRAWLATVVRGDEPWGTGDAVTVTTFHRAKGLEWPVVFAAGLEHGLVPLASAGSPAARAEERRLLYVALSRATSELHCSWAGTPSPLLGPVQQSVHHLDRAAARQPADWRSHLARARGRLEVGARG